MGYLEEITKEQRESIYNYFGHDSKSTQQLVDAMKMWAEKQKHLPEMPDERIFLDALLVNKFRLEAAKKSIDNFYTYLSRHSVLFKYINVADPEMDEYYDKNYHIPLPKLTKDFYRVSIYKTSTTPEDYNDLKTLGINQAICVWRKNVDICCSNIIICDLDGYSFKHMMNMPHFKEIYEASTGMLDSLVQSIHFINCPNFIHKLLSFLQTFMSSKMASRIKIHKNVEGLYKFISKEILPSNYGGTEKCLDELRAELKKELFEYKDEFKKHQHIKVDESLRLEPTDDEFLGVHGNFRKLDVD